MSGFLKNFDRQVSAHILSQAHRLLLTPRYFRYNPANLYYNPINRLSGLTQGHNYTCFALSSISQALVQESLLLNKIIQKQKAEEVEAEIQLNLSYAQDCLKEAQNMIKSGVWAQETDVIASILYANEQQRNLGSRIPQLALEQSPEETLQFYTNYLVPTILKNLKYLSALNVIDITEGLVNAGFKDVGFWTQFLQYVVANVTFTTKHNTVEYEAWSTNSYEYEKNIKKQWKFDWANHSNVKYKRLSTSGAGMIPVFAEQVLLEAWTMLWLPYIQREKRVAYIFPERNEQSHKQSFNIALNNLADSVPDVAELVQTIHKKI